MVKHISTDIPFLWQADPNQIFFVPSDNDVICGRGLSAFRHPGNQRLRILVAEAVPLFATTTCRYEKTKIVRSLVKRVLDRGGRFLKRLPNSDMWYLAGFNNAREKVSHALRDAASDKVKCMRGLVQTRIWDRTPVTDVPCKAAAIPHKICKESDLQAMKTLGTTLLAKAGMDGSFNQFNLDTMTVVSMMNMAVTAKDVAKSIEIMELVGSIDTPESLNPVHRDPNDDFADFDPCSTDVFESLDVFNELSCAELGWS
jgi:hypothetical protein